MMKQMTRSPLFSYVIVAGLACVMGLSYELFVFPNSFAPAGINGLTTMIQYLFHINIGYLSLLINLPLILLAALGCTGIPRTIHRIFARLCGSGRSRRYPRRERLYAVVMFVLSFAVLLLSTASLVGSSYNPFLYFRF